jgi:hypothetical protein
MPVATGVVGDALVMAVIALLDVSAQSSGAAGDNRPQDTLLLGDDSAEPMPMTRNDLCQFQRPAWALEARVHGIGGELA